MMKKYDCFLITTSRQLIESFKGASSVRNVRLDAIDTPAKLNKIVRKKGKILEILILDLTVPEKELDRFIFYIKEYRRDIPVILIKVDSLTKEKEALRNLSVYATIRKPSNKKEVEGILDDLNEILDLDMDKKFEKVHFLEKEGVFACTFKNGREYFLKKEDLPEYDGSRIKNYTLDKDEYYFSVVLESGAKYTVPWDFILHICEEKYEFHRSKRIEAMSSVEIGKRVKEARNRKGLRQVDLAQKTGILRANIARIERGKHNPSLDTLERISDALSIPVVDLIAK